MKEKGVIMIIIFMRQTLADDFWGLHKNMNCPLPLTTKSRQLFWPKGSMIGA